MSKIESDGDAQGVDEDKNIKLYRDHSTDTYWTEYVKHETETCENHWRM